MTEFFSYAVGITLALGAVAMIAFPERILPECGPRKKRFSGRHWGRYHDSQDVEESNTDVVEVGIPARKIMHVAGSRTYAGGRGVRQ